MKALVRCGLRSAAVVIVAGLLAAGAGSAYGKTVYVSTAGNDVNNGLAWSTAKRTVQAGISAAASGDQIWVAAGTYGQNLSLTAGLALYGGFAGTETSLSQRNWKTNVTILDGNHAGTVVTVPISGITGTRIDGFTIRNGEAMNTSRYGGGIWCAAKAPIIVNNTITGNNASSGGGIYYGYYSEAATITNNTIAGNTANRGAGIYCSSIGTVIANNTIVGNSAWASSGWSDGGGIYSVYSPVITNNTIAGNSAFSGGGIYVNGEPQPSNASIANNIVAGNSSGIFVGPNASPNLTYNCVYGNGARNFAGLTDPTGANGNISVDPLLSNLPYGDLHINPGSPCINAGNDSAIVAGWLDMDGQPRKNGAHVDIGADESDGTTRPAGPSVIVRVSLAGNDANNGSAWALAKRTVQAAIDAAAAGHGDVWVQEGTYAERITLRDYAHVYGGFAGAETQRSQRDVAAHVTTLDGAQAGSVVTARFLGCGMCTLDGFTVRNGTGTLVDPRLFGGGIYCRSASPNLSNNTITANSAAYGAGIYCLGGSPAITNNTICDNTVSHASSQTGGGGIACEWSAPTITANTIVRNTALATAGAKGQGGGIYCNYGYPAIAGNTIANNIARNFGAGVHAVASIGGQITGNTITGNALTAESSYARYGGGIHLDSTNLLIANNTISGNTAACGAGIYSSRPCTDRIAGNTIRGNQASTSGGGIHCDYSTASTLTNNTVVANKAGNSGGGIYCYSCSPVITNTIVAFNSSGICASSATPTFNSDCVFGNGAYDYSGITNPTGTSGNIAADPQFADPACHLKAGSPCIDAGDNAAVQAGWTDIDGLARTFNGRVDIGADEFDGTAWPTTLVIVRVSPTGDDANDGSTWPLAKRTVQAGVDAAATVGGEVWVREGTYLERINLRSFVHLFGGFAGGETQRDQRDQRDWSAHVTILDGNFTGGSVVTASGLLANAATIDGFTIRNGRAPSYGNGGGIYCSSSIAIANNALIGNYGYCGGGIYCSASATIRHNTIRDNYASYGGAIYCSAGSPTITGNTITGNNVNGYGGGIDCEPASAPAIDGNVIMSNKAGTGGAIYCASSAGSVTNNTLAANNAYSAGGGLRCFNTSATISNNTIVANSSPQGGGIDFGYNGSSSAAITNTIIAFNSSGIRASATDTLSLRNNCVYGNAEYNYSGLTDPAGTNGNISVDPKLAARPYGNAHIQPDSPCVNAGENTAVQTGSTDVDGQDRITAGTVDIGADESDGVTVWPSGPNAIVRVKPDGDDASDGSSWGLAKRTVQAAIDAAALVGGDVWVQQGTYLGTVVLRNRAYVYGGFAGTETSHSQRNWSAYRSILDGNRTYSVVTAEDLGHNLAAIDGLVIRNGDSYEGGGVYCASAITIANNTITGCTAGEGGGGGIYCTAAALIVNNIISGNSALSFWEEGRGGGIWCGSSSATIVNNTITGNIALAGGGVFCDGSPTIANTIIAFNTSGLKAGETATPMLANNCVYGNTDGNYAGLADPTGTNGNIAVDPKIANLAYGDLHIQPDSPCVDAGDNALIQPGWQDMDGQPRLAAPAVDIGADESDGTVWPGGPNIIVRVRPDGDDANDGSSWPLAKRTVQAAIDAAALVGGDVWVQAGTYVERVTLRDYVHVYGGFAGDETQRFARDFATHVSILDGSQAGFVVTAADLGYRLSTIDGFTIRNGKGGVSCSYASPTISNDTIERNVVGGWEQAGIHCDSSSPLIVNATIRNNAPPSGTSYGGSGISCDGASPTIINSTITGNGFPGGNGIYTYYSYPTVINTIVAFNAAGIRMTGSGGELRMRNSCLYGNMYLDFPYGPPDPNPIGTNGNISANPKFVRQAGPGPDGVWGTADDDGGDLRLRSRSPCIDAGSNADVPADAADLDGDGDVTEPLPLDLAGGARFLDDPQVADTGAGAAPIVDMGAYERSRPVTDVDGDWLTDVVDLLYLVDAFGTYSGDAAYDARCDFNADGAVNVIDLLAIVYSFGK